MTIHHDDALRLANLHLDHLRTSAATVRLRRRLRRRASTERTPTNDRRERPVPAPPPGRELGNAYR